MPTQDDPESLCWQAVRNVITEARNRYDLVIYGTVIPDYGDFKLKFVIGGYQFGQFVSLEYLSNSIVTVEGMSESLYRELRKVAEIRDSRGGAYANEL